jgi:hypothetical protein
VHGTWRFPSINRHVIEYATHPEALDALTASLAVADPPWQKCRQDLHGNALADAQIAANARLPWSKTFISDDLAFDALKSGRCQRAAATVKLSPL